MENILENKILTGINVASDKKAIQFLIANGEPVVAKCEGDCCSSTWVEHIELPAMGFPANVLSVKDLRLPTAEIASEGETIRYYGVKIATDKGDIVINYRNSSNGYYGGNLSWPGDYFSKGSFKQNISTEEWQPVADE